MTRLQTTGRRIIEVHVYIRRPPGSWSRLWSTPTQQACSALALISSTYWYTAPSVAATAQSGHLHSSRHLDVNTAHGSGLRHSINTRIKPGKFSSCSILPSSRLTTSISTACSVTWAVAWQLQGCCIEYMGCVTLGI